MNQSTLEVIDLGIQEQDVYDIEVEDNHNFFGNDILLHNSVYICCDKLIKQSPKELTTQQAIKAINKFSETVVEKEIEKSLQALSLKLNVFKNTYEMKREIIGDVGLWCSMKKYVVRKWMDENKVYEEPKLKITGIEIVRTSTPKIVREKLREVVNIVLDNDNEKLMQVVKDYQKEFVTFKPEDMAFPRSISDIEKYFDSQTIFTKGTPIHVRGALLYNFHLDRLNLTNKYKKIYSGDRIKFLYLKVPNLNNNENIIAFLDKLPKEFNFDQYIDYDVQYEKSFLSAVNILTKACDYDIIVALNDKTMKIDSLFY